MLPIIGLEGHPQYQGGARIPALESLLFALAKERFLGDPSNHQEPKETRKE